MTETEFTFLSANSPDYAKRITACMVVPKHLNTETGLMHFAHGWGGNRYQYREMMREFSERYNLVCLATEYRHSGYDFDPITGAGASIPYDGSHYQVIDCINAVRHAQLWFPQINHHRRIAFGGSQGGHIALLMALFCPASFALVISGSGITHFDAERCRWTGRDMSAAEIAARDVVSHANRFRCPVVLMHGTADTIVPDTHTHVLEKALRNCNADVRVHYYDGGGHSLEPVTTRQAATIELADDWLKHAQTSDAGELERGGIVTIPCADRMLVLDWSKSPEDAGVLQWENAS